MPLNFIQRKLLFAVVLISFVSGLFVCALAGISPLWLFALLPIDFFLIRWLSKRWKHLDDVSNPETEKAEDHPICYCPLRHHNHPPA